MPLSVRSIAHGSAEYAAAVNLRRARLRTPLGLDFTSAQLAAESEDIHLGAFADEDLIGTVSLTPCNDTTMKLRQMAVDDAMQGQGAGAHLLAAAEQATLASHRTHITLAARLSAQGFYARYGYEATGELFEEVSLPHIRMEKHLRQSF